MKGSEYFSKFKPIINVFVMILRVFPRFLLRIMYDFLSRYEGAVSITFRYCFLKVHCGDNIGNSVFIGRNVTLKNLTGFRCGDNLSVHANSYIDACGKITIGHNVSIAHNTSLVSFEHTWEDDTYPIKYNPVTLKEIIIKDDIWIGCGVRILSGANINSRCIIAAGSVVKGTLEKSSIYAGIPCKIIKKI